MLAIPRRAQPPRRRPSRHAGDTRKSLAYDPRAAGTLTGDRINLEIKAPRPSFRLMFFDRATHSLERDRGFESPPAVSPQTISSATISQARRRGTPQSRSKPEEVATAVAFLASDDAEGRRRSRLG